MIITVVAEGVYSVDWPKLRLLVNGIDMGSFEVKSHCEYDFEINLDQDINNIAIEYINKTENHTVVQDGKIVSDQHVELKAIRIDSILLDSWFLTEGHFYPNYFEGFLKICPDAATELKSQLIWHFPGRFKFQSVPNESKFWFWYRDQRRHVHNKKFVSEKDKLRDEAYVGSLESYTDLIEEIKKIFYV